MFAVIIDSFIVPKLSELLPALISRDSSHQHFLVVDSLCQNLLGNFQFHLRNDALWELFTEFPHEIAVQHLCFAALFYCNVARIFFLTAHCVLCPDWLETGVNHSPCHVTRTDAVPFDKCI